MHPSPLDSQVQARWDEALKLGVSLPHSYHLLRQSHDDDVDRASLGWWLVRSNERNHSRGLVSVCDQWCTVEEKEEISGAVIHPSLFPFRPRPLFRSLPFPIMIKWCKFFMCSSARRVYIKFFLFLPIILHRLTQWSFARGNGIDQKTISAIKIDTLSIRRTMCARICIGASL